MSFLLDTNALVLIYKADFGVKVDDGCPREGGYKHTTNLMRLGQNRNMILSCCYRFIASK